MSNFSDSIVNQRFKEVYRHLERERIIKGKSDIAKQLDTYNHIINSILKGERNITMEQLNRLMKLYGINARYMFGSTDVMFDATEEASTKRIDWSSNGRQNIMLVQQKAVAGYAMQASNPAFTNDLPRFSVPGLEGQLVAFEISGDSMYPTLTNSDIVVCERLERGEPIRENSVYIVVTDTVVAKRVHQIKEDNTVRALRLISDNEVFKPYRVDIEEVREVLRVKCRLTNYGIE